MDKPPVNPPRISLSVLQIFNMLLQAGDESRRICGADIMRGTALKSGTLYPILNRMEKVKWIQSVMEQIDPAAAGRPRRRLYKLTASGKKVADEASRSLDRLVGGLALQSSRRKVAA